MLLFVFPFFYVQLNRHYFCVRNDQNDLTSSYNTIMLFKSKFEKHIFSVFKTFFLQFLRIKQFYLISFNTARSLWRYYYIFITVICFNYVLFKVHNVIISLGYYHISNYWSGRTETYKTLFLSDENYCNGSQLKLPVNRGLWTHTDENVLCKCVYTIYADTRFS